jgi:hypothetical protein
MKDKLLSEDKKKDQGGCWGWMKRKILRKTPKENEDTKIEMINIASNIYEKKL